MSVREDTFGLGTIDPAALKQADIAVERLRWIYIHDWAPEALDEMEAAVLSLRRYAKAGGSTDAVRRDALLRLTHDMKGQAGTFGVEILHDFATSLHNVAKATTRIGVREADVFLAHIMAMRTALTAVASNPEGRLRHSLERELRGNLGRITRRWLN